MCAVCASADRGAFEAAVAGGQSVLAAGRAIGLHRDAAYRHIRNHKRLDPPRLAAVPSSAVDTFRAAFGHEPMAHQVTYLESSGHLLVRKGRQVGMTEAAAGLAIHVARATPGSLAAVISPSLRQSTEVATRARLGLWELGERLVQDSASLLRLANGSRILSLPGSARGVRGYAAQLVVVDEAAWVDDETFVAARALVAATGGRLIVQSTPGVAGVGFFYELATDTPPDWSTIVVRSDEARTITAEFLARERAELTENLYRQEYMAEFGSGAVGGVGLFTVETIDRMFQKESS
jgi:hypothetical protein